MYYGAGAHCLMCIEANTIAPAFEKRKKLLFARLTGKETGGKAQVCLPSRRFGGKT